MITTRCETVRLWLQVLDNLEPEESRLLEAHLAGCGECRLRRQQYRDVDRRVSTLVDALPETVSVRSNVVTRIASQETLQRPLSRQRPKSVRGKSRRPLLPRFLAAVPVAAVALALALGFPQVLPEPGSLPSVGAAWPLPRADVEYQIAVDSSRPDHLLGSDNGQVYESWNAGTSWGALAPLPPHLKVHALLVDRAHPNRYLVATSHSIFASRDRGRHWTLRAQALPGAFNMFLLQDPGAPRTMYVGPSILWKSTDAGDHWARAGVGTIFAPNGIQALRVGTGGVVYTGIWGGGVAVSRDGGLTWQRRGKGLAPHVMGLWITPRGRLWASTDRGVFSSNNAGNLWRHTGPWQFTATSVIAGRDFVLAAGQHEVYRSIDGGATWSLAMDGLPLDPYVSDLELDPFHPHRVFAALRGDGLFRSDDNGQHWTAIDAGIPLNAGSRQLNLVLFLRGGALWYTDSQGSDPGVLTVDSNVRLAAPSPDGGAVAYLSSAGGAWAVRVVSSGGSAAHTLASGRTDSPLSLSWSPNSALLAMVSQSEVRISNLAHLQRRWTVSAWWRFVGWDPGVNRLLFWDTRTERIESRDWMTGSVRWPGRAPSYPAFPTLSPDGSHVSYLWHSKLYVALRGTSGSPVASISQPCGSIIWSHDASRLLLSCGKRVLIVDLRAGSVRRLLGGDGDRFVPGSDHNLLYFYRGSLWRRAVSGGAARVTSSAAPIGSSSGT